VFTNCLLQVEDMAARAKRIDAAAAQMRLDSTLLVGANKRQAAEIDRLLAPTAEQLTAAAEAEQKLLAAAQTELRSEEEWQREMARWEAQKHQLRTRVSTAAVCSCYYYCGAGACTTDKYLQQWLQQYHSVACQRNKGSSSIAPCAAW
jgi:hypothetical protein